MKTRKSKRRSRWMRPVPCCTKGQGLVGNIGGRWAVGVDDLEGGFQLW